MTHAIWSSLRRTFNFVDRAVETGLKWIGCFALLAFGIWVGSEVFASRLFDPRPAQVTDVIPLPGSRVAVVVTHEAMEGSKEGEPNLHTFVARLMGEPFPHLGETRAFNGPILLRARCFGWRCPEHSQGPSGSILAKWHSEESLWLCLRPGLQLAYFDELAFGSHSGSVDFCTASSSSGSR